MTTTTTLTPAQFREELEGLLELATQYAALESRIESKAMELELSDWVMEFDSNFLSAVGAQVKHALDAAKQESGHSDYRALDLCQDIDDAITIVKFAIERDDRAN
jgi:hypothetical protein